MDFDLGGLLQLLQDYDVVKYKGPNGLELEFARATAKEPFSPAAREEAQPIDPIEHVLGVVR